MQLVTYWGMIDMLGVPRTTHAYRLYALALHAVNASTERYWCTCCCFCKRYRVGKANALVFAGTSIVKKVIQLKYYYS